MWPLLCVMMVRACDIVSGKNATASASSESGNNADSGSCVSCLDLLPRIVDVSFHSLPCPSQAMILRLWLLHIWLAVLTWLGPSSAYHILSDDSLRTGLPKPQEVDFNIKNGPILSPILVPRVPGTPGSTKVLKHFVDWFKLQLPDWQISFQNSTSKTPVHGNKDVPFVNFIASRDPPWSTPNNVGRLTLVAHYDSKFTPSGFIGAIDSAAPCAMIMHAVKSIDEALTKKWSKIQADDFDADFEEHTGIQVILLDGEEAFLNWNDHDSIYGARSLAEEWETTVNPAMSVYKSPLDSIELFVLLDLLGSGEYHPIPSWQHSSHWSYVKMATLEQRLQDLGLFTRKSENPWLNEGSKKETDVFSSYVMQDDHLPFIARGVQVLHLIPGRFPSVWHTINDDGPNLDMSTVLDWALLTSAFAAEYLELDGYFETSKLAKKDTITSKTEL